MADDDVPPEPDRRDGAPHPRETAVLFGQSTAEAAFLNAFNAGRQHHAWLISGPRGIGKATLAWKIARFLLATPRNDGGMFAGDPPTSLDIAPDHPVARRTRALSEPGLLLVRRPWDQKDKKLRTVITVDEIRKLHDFFNLSASDGGRRVVIIDPADDMNTSASNALLKLLEEPPKNATLLLISHTPSRLLPTIRSRCRTLRCTPLPPPDMAQALHAAGVDPGGDTAALAELAEGSVGEAMSLLHLDGLALYHSLVRLTGTAPNIDRAALLALAGTVNGRQNEQRFDLTVQLILRLLSRLARTGAGLPPAAAITESELAMLHRLAPDIGAARIWADLQQTLGARMAHGKAVNLDPSALILDMGLTLNEGAARATA
ncbi:DNA polymerase III subunit delta' [Oceaniglobus indicus]|uniref:DNA polymerase III subunit delta' n=1 Tax=Oceaniglobus indicus TaxID=2047749 RepID=UPI000C197F17|nr:DNA polymerase III subunit delta' [Oceaniglobus indicus]